MTCNLSALYTKSKNITSGKSAYASLSKSFHCSLNFVSRISLLQLF